MAAESKWHLLACVCLQAMKIRTFKYFLKGPIFYPLNHSTSSGGSALAWFLTLREFLKKYVFYWIHLTCYIL